MSTLNGFLFSLVVLFVTYSFVASSDNDYCYKLDDSQVRYLFSKWSNAIETQNAHKVVEEYWEHSILLPTLSAVSRTDKAGKLEYFVEFLKKQPTAHVLEEYVFNDCRNSQYSGLYAFALKHPQNKNADVVVHARFTFVWVSNDDNVWKIKTHHSSLIPSDPKITPSNTNTQSLDYQHLNLRYTSMTTSQDLSWLNQDLYKF